ncbi:uncharacterized protein TNCV_319611 [Trichonephila clavipes]|nr:uncharacterized protein TNCV_319611 [Trichonephila clavipes]
MACDAEDCGFQILNDDEIVTSVQEESDPVRDETDEDNNNESSKGPSNADTFSALDAAMEWFPTTAAQENQRPCIEKRSCTMLPESILATDIVIFNPSQMTRTTPELTVPSPNFHTIPNGRTFEPRQI